MKELSQYESTVLRLECAYEKHKKTRRKKSAVIRVGLYGLNICVAQSCQLSAQCTLSVIGVHRSL